MQRRHGRVLQPSPNFRSHAQWVAPRLPGWRGWVSSEWWDEHVQIGHFCLCRKCVNESCTGREANGYRQPFSSPSPGVIRRLSVSSTLSTPFSIPPFSSALLPPAAPQPPPPQKKNPSGCRHPQKPGTDTVPRVLPCDFSGGTKTLLSGLGSASGMRRRGRVEEPRPKVSLTHETQASRAHICVPLIDLASPS